MNSWLFFSSVCMFFVIANSNPGGWSQVTDLNSPDIQKNGRKAVSIVSKSINSQYHMKLMNVTEAQTQVVAGMNYKFRMIMGLTECKKSENLAEQQIEDCPLQKCGEPLQCNATMWAQIWTGNYQVTDYSCEPGEPSC